MIKTLSKSINKELKYVKELHLNIFSFNSVQFLLEDSNSFQYLLLLLFDKQTELAIQNEESLFKGVIGDVSCALFEYPLRFTKNIFRINYDPCFTINELIGSNCQEYSLNCFNEIFNSGKNYLIESSTFNLAVNINKRKAIVGTWMNHFGRIDFLYVCNFIFSQFKNVKSIDYKNLLFNPELDFHYWRHNDFYLPLPNSVDELNTRISSKSRHNLRREKKIIVDVFGSLDLIDIPFEKIDESIIDLFYKYKELSHGVKRADYDITILPITNVYLLKAGDEIKGIALSCEQSDIVFIENHTFDYSLKQYSFGQILYDMYLDALILKGKKGLALSGGNLDYKKRYGSVCYNAYSGTIKRKSMRLFKYLVKTSFDVNNKKYHERRVLHQLLFE